MPVVCPALQLNPETDWMYTADAGAAGLGLRDGRMMVPRGKMLGGSSGINYMAYVRGHPGDFDAWAADGATGWSSDAVLPYFKKSEGLAASGDIVVDPDAHNTEGPLGVSVCSRCCAARKSSSRLRWRPVSLSVITTAETAKETRVSCRCCRPLLATASARAPTTRSSKATSSSEPISR